MICNQWKTRRNKEGLGITGTGNTYRTKTCFFDHIKTKVYTVIKGNVELFK